MARDTIDALSLRLLRTREAARQRTDTRMKAAAGEHRLRREVTRQSGHAAAGPRGRSGHEEPFDRRAVARVAGQRPEDEVLTEMVAARNAVAADEVWVVRFQIAWREHHLAQDQILDTRRVLGQLCQY